jgi:6,7-dimethyl-8-ribityllumazine synthase
MTQTVHGQLSAHGLTFGIVISRYNSIVTQPLLNGALDCLVRHGAEEKDVAVVYCPGSFEIPQVTQQLAASGTVDGIICIGCVIRGETPHFDYIAGEVFRGISQIALATGTPIALGVLTTENLEQALERAGSKGGNKGWDAALSIIELVNVSKQLSSRKKRSRG